MWEKINKGDEANLENVREMLTEARHWETYIGEDGKPHER